MADQYLPWSDVSDLFRTVGLWPVLSTAASTSIHMRFGDLRREPLVSQIIRPAEPNECIPEKVWVFPVVETEGELVQGMRADSSWRAGGKNRPQTA